MAETGKDFSQFQQTPKREAPQITPYAISLEAFQATPPDNLTEYQAPGQWTRENFTVALTDSFARSQGKVLAQFAVLEWQRRNQGFDYEATMQNYIQAGGRACLSPAEQAYLIDAFKRVRQHRHGYYTSIGHAELDRTDEQILEDVDRTVTQFFEPNRSNYTFPDSWDELSGMPWQDFLQQLHQHLTPAKPSIAWF